MQITQSTTFEQLISPAGESSSSDGEFANLLNGIFPESETQASPESETVAGQDLELADYQPRHLAGEIKDRFGQKVTLPVASRAAEVRGDSVSAELVSEEAVETEIRSIDANMAAPTAAGDVLPEEGEAGRLPQAPEAAIADGVSEESVQPSLVESSVPQMSSVSQDRAEISSNGREDLERKGRGETRSEHGEQDRAVPDQKVVSPDVSEAVAGSENLDVGAVATLAEAASHLPASTTPSATTPLPLPAAAVTGRQTSLVPTAVPDERAAQAMQTLRKIDTVEGMLLNESSATEEALPEAEIVEAEIVDHEEAPRSAEGERLVRVQGGSAEQSFTPLNLGKPTFSMAAHELLQGSVVDRQAAPAAHFVNLAPAAVSMTAPVATGAASSHVLHQVVLATSTQRLAQDVGTEMVRDIRSGKSEVMIRLDPAELGRIEVKMTFSEEGRIRAIFAVDNPQTAELLRRDADSLLRSLTDAGIKAEADDLQFDMKQGTNPGDGRDENSGELASGESSGESSEADDTPRLASVMRGRLV